jgi:hypothetical protein
VPVAELQGAQIIKNEQGREFREWRKSSWRLKKSIKNPKHEIRPGFDSLRRGENPKQIQITKIQNSKRTVKGSTTCQCHLTQINRKL